MEQNQRRVFYAQEKAQRLPVSVERTQKVKARKHLGYGRVMIDLLKDPVSLGLKGGYRGYQR